MKKLILSTIFVLSGLYSYAQTLLPAKQWDKVFGGTGEDYCFDVIQTSDGGYFLGGLSDSGISGDKSGMNWGGGDFWVLKLDSAGNKIWDRTIGGDNTDKLNIVIQTTNGEYILGGTSQSNVSGDKSQPNKGFGRNDYWILKLDASGFKVWDKTYGGSGMDALTSLRQTPDGGFILGGSSNSGINSDKSEISRGDIDYWILKIDANGNKQWDKTYGGSKAEYIFSLITTSDGGYMLGGWSDSPISGDKSAGTVISGVEDIWIVKLDSAGNKLWDKTIGGNSADQLFSLAQASDGGYILGGSSDSNIGGNKSENIRGRKDFWIVRLDGNGNILWDKTLGGDRNEYLYTVLETPDKGIVASGRSESDLSGEKSETFCSNGLYTYDYWIIKLDQFGNKIWDKSFGGNSNDELRSLKLTTDGGYILSGHTASVFSTDKTQPSQGGHDYWIIKLGPDLSSRNILALTGESKSLKFSVSPNPNKGNFTVLFSNTLNHSEPVAIAVTDILGREVLNRKLDKVGFTNKVEFYNLGIKGMYLLQVKTGVKVHTQKILVE